MIGITIIQHILLMVNKHFINFEESFDQYFSEVISITHEWIVQPFTVNNNIILYCSGDQMCTYIQS